MNQSIFDGMMAQISVQRKAKCSAQGQFTLGELVAKLEQFNREDKLQFSDGTNPDSMDSYRGYYEDLAIDRSFDIITVGTFLDRAIDAVGNTFIGYKGGDFLMNKMTLVWVAEYGDTSNDGIVNIVQDGDIVKMVLEEIEDD